MQLRGCASLANRRAEGRQKAQNMRVSYWKKQESRS
jgi:hypothetical protein